MYPLLRQVEAVVGYWRVRRLKLFSFQDRNGLYEPVHPERRKRQLPKCRQYTRNNRDASTNDVHQTRLPLYQTEIFSRDAFVNAIALMNPFA